VKLIEREGKWEIHFGSNQEINPKQILDLITTTNPEISCEHEGVTLIEEGEKSKGRRQFYWISYLKSLVKESRVLEIQDGKEVVFTFARCFFVKKQEEDSD
jgi:hypothetical protein